MNARESLLATALPAAAIGPAAAQGLPPARPQPLAPRRLQSQQLLAGEAEIEIAHGSSVYRLRLTSQGKLILTK